MLAKYIIIILSLLVQIYFFNFLLSFWYVSSLKVAQQLLHNTNPKSFYNILGNKINIFIFV